MFSKPHATTTAILAALLAFGIISAAQAGGTAYHSDGSSTTQIGNNYYHSDGSSSTKIGNSYYNSDGSSSTRIGDTYYNSDGSSTSGATRIDGGYPGWRP